ncbi:MAG TPA: alpha/beta hydrolase [Solirubrobacteraceae bacterium]|nr:alpha/beta hydrolase [Solirubrobacteraceae bacterium]
MTSSRLFRALALTLAALSIALAAGSASAASLKVTWMTGFAAPGTPAKYNKVGVLKIGPPSAKNVLVLEPGTSAGSAYFVPFAQWLVSKTHGWQVWSVERRENLFEDQSEMNLAKLHKVTGQRLFDYYLGYLADPSITDHIHPVLDSQVGFARNWGLNVAIEDLHRVIEAATRRGGKVVLGGHSLGGSVITAYATWDFHGRPGAAELAGLVYDDGASFRAPVSRATARGELQALKAGTPWRAFSGIPAPDLGLFAATGSLGALIDPNAPSVAYASPLLPQSLKPPVQPTNLALFGYDTDPATSKLVFASWAHVGKLDTSVTPAGWDRAGAITPLQRWAAMLATPGLQNVDGSEWYFPQRLTDDTGAIGNGLANPAQAVLGVHSVFGRKLPRTLLMYAFGAYGGQAILDATTALAKQSHIPMRNLTLVNRHATYAHNDPASAYPHNVFFDHLVAFLAKISPHP